jgi:hypothetical protein
LPIIFAFVKPLDEEEEFYFFKLSKRFITIEDGVTKVLEVQLGLQQLYRKKIQLLGYHEL